MGASTVRCHVLGDDVTVVTDLAGQVVNVICPKFRRLTYNCEKKLEGAGVVGTFLGRLADRTTGSKAVVCEFIDAAGSLTARLAKK
jgi:F420-0:gamma-glutamyl ligase-like protein